MAGALPEYEHPPLNEVAMGVQFEPLKRIRTAHFGLFWMRIRDRYPRTEDKVPLQHAVENAQPQPVESRAAVTLFEKLPLPRCWFLDKTETSLIQVQRDRFLRNWRQVEGTEPYPRYSNLANLFHSEWNEFLSFVKAEDLGEARINQCELTYVNHFEPGIGWKDFANMDNLFSFLVPPTSEFFKGLDVLSWHGRSKLPDGQSGGHVKVDSVFRSRDLKIVLQMSLTARGAPAGVDNLSSWFDMAHEWIVRTFDELTHPNMHKLWGKKS